MNGLKLCKTTVVRTLLPLAAVLVFFLVLLAAKALSVEGVSKYYELLTGAAAFAAAFFTVKEIFSLSVCCGVSRKTSFTAILICAFVTAFIVVAAHSIESFIFADKLKGTVIRLDGVAVDYTHAEILQNYSLLSLSFSKSAAYIYSMLFVRTFLIFFSGSRLGSFVSAMMFFAIIFLSALLLSVVIKRFNRSVAILTAAAYTALFIKLFSELYAGNFAESIVYRRTLGLLAVAELAVFFAVACRRMDVKR